MVLTVATSMIRFGEASEYNLYFDYFCQVVDSVLNIIFHD